MGDLDELAAAARRTDAPPPTIPQRAAYRPATTRKPVARWKLVAAGAVVALAGVLAWAATRTRPHNFGHGVYLAHPAVQQERVDPGFDVSLDGSYGWQAWRIKNESNDPLIVSRVRFNGEFDVVKTQGERWDKWGKPPTTITIGESWFFVQSSDSQTIPSYRKDVVYLDLDTSRGRFRYRPASAAFEKLP